MKNRSLLINLVGELVEVVTSTSVSVTNATEEGHFEKKSPHVVSGYLIDIDHDWMYLGSSDGVISDMIRLKRIIHVGKSRPVDNYDVMIDEAQASSDEQYN